ncbi:MAG: divalent-cation tolerance protein CutA [Gemmatimonadota bacterium]
MTASRGGSEGALARVVLVTAPDTAVAGSLARRLVEERLAACGSILPNTTSIYRWQGAVEHATEATIVLKTTAAAVDRLARRVAELHPYDVPEVLALPVDGGHGPYLEWIAESVSDE